MTYIHSHEEKEVKLWAGFDFPFRDNRLCKGIPQIGKWDANGGNIWLNNNQIKPPKWNEPGKYSYRKETWFNSANEIPYKKEEFYWSRDPVSITLRKGWNKVLIRVPSVYKKQNWFFTFVPIEFKDKDQINPSEVEGLSYSTDLDNEKLI